MSVRNTFRDNPAYIIREICVATNIPYRNAFKGLCGEKTVGKYKNGEKLFDIFIFSTILERLGFCPDHFEMLVSEKVHEFFLWYEKCLNCMEKSDWKCLKKGIDEFNLMALTNERIQKSYRDFFNYVLERYCNKNTELAYTHIKNALAATGLGLSEISDKNPLLSAFEWHLLLNLCDMEILLNPEKKTEIIDRLYEIYLYKMKNAVDEDLVGRVIPKTALFILNAAKDDFPLDKRLGIEKNTVRKMVKASVISDLPAILEFFIKDVESSCEEDIYIKQYTALKNIFDYLDIETSYNIAKPAGCKKRYTVLSDYLKIRRREFGLTCEEVSEGICSAENYQRIERGKIFPSTKTLAMLSNRLGMNFTFIKGDIEAGSHKTFLLAAECKKLVASKKFRSVHERLSELKTSINMDMPENKRFIRLLEISMGEETNEAKISELKNLFESKERRKNRYVSEPIENQGMSLLAKLIGTDCIKNLEALLENESEISFGNRKKYIPWYNIKAVIKTLIHLYNKAGRHEKSKALADEALRKMFEENDVDILVPVLEDMAEIKEKTKNDKNSYETVFYIAELFELYDDSRRIKQSLL